MNSVYLNSLDGEEIIEGNYYALIDYNTFNLIKLIKVDKGYAYYFNVIFTPFKQYKLNDLLSLSDPSIKKELFKHIRCDYERVSSFNFRFCSDMKAIYLNGAYKNLLSCKNYPINELYFKILDFIDELKIKPLSDFSISESMRLNEFSFDSQVLLDLLGISISSCNTYHSNDFSYKIDDDIINISISRNINSKLDNDTIEKINNIFKLNINNRLNLNLKTLKKYLITDLKDLFMYSWLSKLDYFLIKVLYILNSKNYKLNVKITG